MRDFILAIRNPPVTATQVATSCSTTWDSGHIVFPISPPKCSNDPFNFVSPSPGNINKQVHVQSNQSMHEVVLHTTVQITFIFIGQTRLVFGKCVCTCVTKHSNAFRTFLNWLKNSKRVWHEPKRHIFAFASFRKFWSAICERLVGLVSFKTNVSETAGQIHLSDNVRCNGE